MTTLVTIFKSTDSGAPVLSATVGAFTSVLSHCLIIGKVYTTADDVSFNDRTTNARLSDGTGFLLFPTPATADRVYIGHSSQFSSLTFAYQTAGTSATYVWEYWNGSAWTTLTVTDGTTSFTVAGTVTWVIPGSWATTSVNSTTMYWVRVRFTGSNPATNPLVDTVSYLGWLEVQSGTNQRDYKQAAGSNNCILSVNDNASHVTALDREARIKAFETSTGVGTGTNQFPNTSQGVGGNTGYLIVRKGPAGSVPDATARSWVVIADKYTIYFFNLSTDTANVYTAMYFGDLYSLGGSGDPGRCLIAGRYVENSASMSTSQELLDTMLQLYNTAGGGFPVQGYLNRDFQGSVVSTGYVKAGALEYGSVGSISGIFAPQSGILAYKNPADSLIYLAPMWVSTPVNTLVLFRGRMRGMWHFCHAISNVADRDTIVGGGDLAGKSFIILKQTVSSGVHCIETSDTWETN